MRKQEFLNFSDLMIQKFLNSEQNCVDFRKVVGRSVLDVFVEPDTINSFVTECMNLSDVRPGKRRVDEDYGTNLINNFKTKGSGSIKVAIAIYFGLQVSSESEGSPYSDCLKMVDMSLVKANEIFADLNILFGEISIQNLGSKEFSKSELLIPALISKDFELAPEDFSFIELSTNAEYDFINERMLAIPKKIDVSMVQSLTLTIRTSTSAPMGDLYLSISSECAALYDISVFSEYFVEPHDSDESFEELNNGTAYDDEKEELWISVLFPLSRNPEDNYKEVIKIIKLHNDELSQSHAF